MRHRGALVIEAGVNHVDAAEQRPGGGDDGVVPYRGPDRAVHDDPAVGRIDDLVSLDQRVTARHRDPVGPATDGKPGRADGVVEDPCVLAPRREPAASLVQMQRRPGPRALPLTSGTSLAGCPVRGLVLQVRHDAVRECLYALSATKPLI